MRRAPRTLSSVPRQPDHQQYLTARRARLLAVLAPLLLVTLALAITWSSRDRESPASDEFSDSVIEPQLGLTEPDDGAQDDHGTPASPFSGIAQPAPTATPGRLQPTTYVVREGDTLLEIAELLGLRLETVTWANLLENPDLLAVGQKLVIPPADGLMYPVDPGETLFEIALRYGLDLAEVAQANGLSDPDALPSGIELFLPGARPAARTRTTPAGGGETSGIELANLDGPLPENTPALVSAAWLRTLTANALYEGPGARARRYTSLPVDVRLERTGDLAGRRLPVRDPGDGRTRQAMSGWIDLSGLEPARAPSPRELPRAYPAATRMDITHNFVPYRGQLDGSSYAEANCGPTAVGMVLERYGISAPLSTIRSRVLAAQGFGGNGTGTLLTALADVAEGYGLKSFGLRAGGGLRRWSLDDIRDHLAARRPVVLQARYRALPGREGSSYYGDHYIVITGVLDDGFLYNDPIDYDGPGWDRVISGERLARAMEATDSRFARAAFSVAK